MQDLLELFGCMVIFHFSGRFDAVGRLGTVSGLPVDGKKASRLSSLKIGWKSFNFSCCNIS